MGLSNYNVKSHTTDTQSPEKIWLDTIQRSVAKTGLYIPNRPAAPHYHHKVPTEHV